MRRAAIISEVAFHVGRSSAPTRRTAIPHSHATRKAGEKSLRSIVPMSRAQEVLGGTGERAASRVTLFEEVDTKIICNIYKKKYDTYNCLPANYFEHNPRWAKRFQPCFAARCSEDL